MKKIILMDAFSTMHVGNGALLDNTIKVLKKAYPESEITIFTRDIETNKVKYENLQLPLYGNFWHDESKLGKPIWLIMQFLFMLLHVLNQYTFKMPVSYIYFNKHQKNTLKKIEEADLCVSLSGEQLSDTFYKPLSFFLFSFWIAIKAKSKFVLFPQSIGPLNNKFNRKLVFNALKEASYLVGRDKVSYETLKSLNFDENIVLYVPDVAIQQEIIDTNIHNYFKDNDKKVIGVTVSKMSNEIKTTVNYEDKILTGLVNSLDPKQYKILLMPSNYTRTGESEDYRICKTLEQKLSATFETSILENRAYFPDEYLSLQTQLELFLSTRMHVAILSTSRFVPTITINTQRKIRGYMNNVNMNDYCLDFDKIDDLSDLIITALQNRDAIRKELEIQIDKLKSIQEGFIEKLKKIDDR